jgi:diacylglycerol kinase (ATP)
MTLLILNPSAGAGRCAARLHSQRERMRRHWPWLEWRESRSAEHVTELAHGAAERGEAEVLVAGGDGTVHAAAAALAGTPTALGILPAGTGNDIAASAGLPRELGRAIDALALGHQRAIDVGQVEGRIFCCVLGVGMDTQALRRINSARLIRRGRLLYTAATIEAILRYRPQRVRVLAGDLRWSGEMMFAAVTNTPTYAGGFRLAPQARIGDGRLDLCVFPGAGRGRMLADFGRVARQLEPRGVVRGQGAEIRIDSELPLPVTLDGELTSLTTSFLVQVLPGALRLLGAPPPPRSAAA